MLAQNRLFFLYLTSILYIILCPTVGHCVDQKASPFLTDEPELMNTAKPKDIQTPHVAKTTLCNGMTVLVREVHTVPKVIAELWYDVGSIDEETGEKGVAHLIEHMIFKGTQKLSESDINVITHLLSGSTNAFTSYDYTGYYFIFPSQTGKKRCLLWQIAWSTALLKKTI